MSEPIPIQDGRGLEQNQNGMGIVNPGDPSYTLTATEGASVMAPMVFEPRALSRIEGHDPAEIAPTLRAHMGDNQLATFYGVKPTPTGNLTPWPDMGQANMVYRTDTVARTVDNNRHNILTPGVFVKSKRAQSAGVRENNVTNALATGGEPGQGYTAVRTEAIIRRLTPTECERLQGFPDDHTLLRADGKEQANAHRYKQMGNAVAIPVVEWVIAGIVAIHQKG